MDRSDGRPVDEPGAKTLLLGMGNPIVTDDAVGIMLARDVGAALGPRSDVDVIDECSIGGLNLLDLVAGYDRLIALDSIKTRDGVPGTWYRFDATDLRETMNLRNVHDANFATAMALGRSVGMHLPDDGAIHILAVEIDDNVNFSEELSPVLAAAYDELRDEILAEVCRVLDGEAASEATGDEPATARSATWR
jgi:hydrogenase maturation protease